jgi:glucose-6-phosphate-specific signal transduction histidine kinase
MPLPLALPVGVLLGMALAWIARAELARSEVPLVLARPFLVALGLGLLVFAPVTGYFVALHGDWAYLYLVRSGRIPSALDLVFVLACGASVPAGFALATRWAIQRRSTALLQASAAVLALTILATAILAGRLGVSGSYAQVHGGFGTVPLGKSPLGRGVLLSWIALATAYTWSAWVLRRR